MNNVADTLFYFFRASSIRRSFLTHRIFLESPVLVNVMNDRSDYVTFVDVFTTVLPPVAETRNPGVVDGFRQTFLFRLFSVVSFIFHRAHVKLFTLILSTLDLFHSSLLFSSISLLFMVYIETSVVVWPLYGNMERKHIQSQLHPSLCHSYVTLTSRNHVYLEQETPKTEDTRYVLVFEQITVT